MSKSTGNNNPKRTAPNVKSTYNPTVDDSFSDLVKKHLGRELPKTQTKEDKAMDKAQTIGWAQTLTIIISIIGALYLFSNSTNSRFDSMDSRLDSMDSRLDSMDSRLTGIEVKLESVETGLTARIDAVETKFDNKFNNLADMMIVAHTNGNVTEAELVEIWGRVKAP